MGMFIVVLDSFEGEIFDFKVKQQGLIAGTVHCIGHLPDLKQYFYVECVLTLNVFKIVLLVDFIMFSKTLLILRFFIFDFGQYLQG